MNKLWWQNKLSENCTCRQKRICRQSVPVGKTICRQNGVGKMIVGKVIVGKVIVGKVIATPTLKLGLA